MSAALERRTAKLEQAAHPGANQIALSCRLTNTCVVPAAAGVRRQWRQLFLR